MSKMYVHVLVLIYAVILCHGNECDVYKQKDPDLEVIGQCKRLVDVLEATLLANQNDVYILQEVFTSSQYDPPTVLLVHYTLTYKRGEEIRQEKGNMGWTSSSVFTVIDPIMIVALETGIPVLMQRLGSSNTDLLPEISLSLDITDTSMDIQTYSSDQINYAMDTITSRLKEYAYRDKIVPESSSELKGYSWKLKHESAAVFAEIILLILLFFISLKFTCYFSNQLQTRDPMRLLPAGFWGMSTVFVFFNLIDALVNCILITEIFKHATNNEERSYGYSKLAVFMLVIVFGFIWMACGCIMAPKFASPPKYTCPFCCTCFCSRRQKARFLYGCGFFQIAVFCFLTVSNIIPVLVLIFVHPVIVLSHITLLVTFIVSFVIWVTLPFTATTLQSMTKSNVVTSQQVKYVKCLWHLFLFSLFVVVVFYVISIYLRILWRSSGSNDYFKIVFTFVLTTVSPITLFVIKRKFLDKRKRISLDNKEADDAQRTDQTEVSLEDLEEGRGANDTPEVVVELHDKENTRTDEGLGVNCDTQPLIDSDETAL